MRMCESCSSIRQTMADPLDHAGTEEIAWPSRRDPLHGDGLGIAEIYFRMMITGSCFGLLS
jgi:hypothetical protein